LIWALTAVTALTRSVWALTIFEALREAKAFLALAISAPYPEISVMSRW
jgi:hypothetical protein